MTARNDRVTAARTRAAMTALFAALSGRGELARCFAPDVTLTTMETGEVVSGRDAVASLLDAVYRVAFNAAPVVRSLVAIPGLAMAEADFCGIHVGEFAGVAPTGREVNVAHVIACTVAGRTITAIRIYLPLDALSRQLR